MHNKMVLAKKSVTLPLKDMVKMLDFSKIVFLSLEHQKLKLLNSFFMLDILVNQKCLNKRNEFINKHLLEI